MMVESLEVKWMTAVFLVGFLTSGVRGQPKGGAESCLEAALMTHPFL